MSGRRVEEQGDGRGWVLAVVAQAAGAPSLRLQGFVEAMDEADGTIAQPSSRPATLSNRRLGWNRQTRTSPSQRARISTARQQACDQTVSPCLDKV
jgi:hypothetical protein